MKRWMLFTIVVVVIVCGLAACTEDQMQVADKAAGTAADVVQTAEGVVNSPAGFLIPPDIRLVISLAGALVLGAANGWQAFRNGQTQKAMCGHWKR